MYGLVKLAAEQNEQEKKKNSIVMPVALGTAGAGVAGVAGGLASRKNGGEQAKRRAEITAYDSVKEELDREYQPKFQQANQQYDESMLNRQFNMHEQNRKSEKLLRRGDTDAAKAVYHNPGHLDIEIDRDLKHLDKLNSSYDAALEDIRHSPDYLGEVRNAEVAGRKSGFRRGAKMWAPVGLGLGILGSTKINKDRSKEN